MSLMQVALEYVEKRKWSVIPVGRNKRPVKIKSTGLHFPWRKFQDKRATRDEIVMWWNTWPDAQIGIVTGAVSELVVVDIEKNGLGIFPEIPGLSAKTQGGGIHYYCAYEHSTPVKRVLSHEGVHVGDVRTDGGYVVAPPSVGEKGSYEWVGTGLDLGEIPAWVRADFVEIETTLATHLFPKLSDVPSIVSGEYPSRSERLMAVARRVFNAGGSDELAWLTCVNDEAGSKIIEKGEVLGRRWFDDMMNKIRKTELAVEEAVVRVRWIARAEGENGERVILLLEDDKRRFRTSMARGSGIWQELHACTKGKLRCGDKLRVRLYQTLWNGIAIWKIKGFLAKES